MSGDPWLILGWALLGLLALIYLGGLMEWQTFTDPHLSMRAKVAGIPSATLWPLALGRLAGRAVMRAIGRWA